MTYTLHVHVDMSLRIRYTEAFATTCVWRSQKHFPRFSLSLSDDFFHVIIFPVFHYNSHVQNETDNTL